MAVIKPKDMSQLDNLSRNELMQYSKRTQNNLIRRRKTLQKNVEDNPGMYSPFGLRELEGRTDEAGRQQEGIPSLSKKDGTNALRAKAKRLYHLDNLETTRSQGAKDVQQRQTRLILNLPAEGRLKASDRKRYNEAVQYNKDNPNAMSNYWSAFEHFKRENLYRGLDSKQLLNEYRPVIDQIRKDGYTEMTDQMSKISDYVDESYRKNNTREDMAGQIEAESSWFD